MKTVLKDITSEQVGCDAPNHEEMFNVERARFPDDRVRNISVSQ